MPDKDTSAFFAKRLQIRQNRLARIKQMREYVIYTHTIAVSDRTSGDPQTPPLEVVSSVRTFERALRQWKRNVEIRSRTCTPLHDLTLEQRASSNVDSYLLSNYALENNPRVEQISFYTPTQTTRRLCQVDGVSTTEASGK
jgi:hypothetical protein